MYTAAVQTLICTYATYLQLKSYLNKSGYACATSYSVVQHHKRKALSGTPSFERLEELQIFMPSG